MMSWLLGVVSTMVMAWLSPDSIACFTVVVVPPRVLTARTPAPEDYA